ncbi:hypothetical protein [Ruminiclostridium cellobioparum]|jgi:hypothetical protein|uniref:hypothetical protein n=1 Tax=Ruminiclostridium cellobioparum TaxID=29355 RepID=UPI0028A9049B|nr:hypothetical protein [Ruminiclostridium cellobioparum]
MKEFKLSNRYFFNNIVVIILAVIVGIILKSGFAIIILAVLISAAMYDFIKKYFLTYIIGEEGLIKKTIMKTNVILKWEEVQKIAKIANAKESVGVFSCNNKFIINPMIKNYKDMIRIIVYKCSNNAGVLIDAKVIE